MDKPKKNSSYTHETSWFVSTIPQVSWNVLPGSQVIVIDDIGEVKQLDDVDSTIIQEWTISRSATLRRAKYVSEAMLE